MKSLRVLGRSKVTGLTTLLVAMDYSAAPNIQAQVPGIASTEWGAQAFVSRLVMEAVLFDADVEWSACFANIFTTPCLTRDKDRD
ncbi:hypothetical protein KIN20_032934 [Parelaphostrongylus tenuis]|uniref:Uncharacterized protein n=1 Tax=Parelaphostrongylus tenuis TaxID=148309 RepID=A0AAD5WIU8_PARTN|nr:hypothetical protein KIN20_032934 [Parelaphostrongylus tenuis]